MVRHSVFHNPGKEVTERAEQAENGAGLLALGRDQADEVPGGLSLDPEDEYQAELKDPARGLCGERMIFKIEHREGPAVLPRQANYQF